MNEGTRRVLVKTNSRAIDGLHCCDNCTAILMRAFPVERGGLVLLSATPWRGACDLCRFTTALAEMLGQREPVADTLVAMLERELSCDT